jgi:hypothetical protein
VWASTKKVSPLALIVMIVMAVMVIRLIVTRLIVTRLIVTRVVVLMSIYSFVWVFSLETPSPSITYLCLC